MNWLLVDTTHPTWNSALVRLRKRHAAFWPENVFSIVENDAGTQALVKCDGAHPEWRQGKFVDGLVIETYTPDTHDAAIELLRGPEWSNLRLVEGV